MGYRHHLSEILLFSNPFPPFVTAIYDHDIEVMRGIIRLLSAQERGGDGLDCLVIRSPYVLKLFKSTVGGGTHCHVKKLLIWATDREGEVTSSILTMIR